MFRALTLIALLTLSASPAFAWGKTGHCVAGEIAEDHLTDEARTAIADILGNESLAEASTWPDFMRSSPEQYWRGEAGPYHYVTIPVGQAYAETEVPTSGDAITALAGFRATLRDPDTSLEDKQLALRFLVHIIGDLHQPLHTGNGTDRGGNDFKVTWFGEESNLHAVWDSGIIDHEDLSYTEWASWLGVKITPALAVEWCVPDPELWVSESAAIRDNIYPETNDLSWNYVFDHRATVRTRLSQAGVRIAAYLNDVFEAGMLK